MEKIVLGAACLALLRNSGTQQVERNIFEGDLARDILLNRFKANSKSLNSLSELYKILWLKCAISLNSQILWNFLSFYSAIIAKSNFYNLLFQKCLNYYLLKTTRNTTEFIFKKQVP